MATNSSTMDKEVEDVIEEVAGNYNLPTDENPFDIDAILDAIPENRLGMKYTDGWDPTKLDEELAKHPFFMKEMPKEGDELHPLYEALQQLKYSEEDNTQEELALNYKEDGLFHFKLKKYRLAILCFTEAIRKASSDQNTHKNHELIAQLYNNRAASHFHLQNYRSALSDCESSLKHKSDYFKPLFKAIECCMKTKKWKKAIEFCTNAAELQPNNSEVRRLQLLAMRNMKTSDAYERRNAAKQKSRDQKNEVIMKYIEERGIKCRKSDFLNDDPDRFVKLGEDGRLEWPVLLYYPQFSQSDFIEAFHEDTTFEAHLTEILETERPHWDKDDEYHVNTVDLYFINFKTGAYESFDKTLTIGEVLQKPSYFLPTNGVPTFFVMASKSEMCKLLLERMANAI